MIHILPAKGSGNNPALEQARTPDEVTSIQLVTLNLIEANPFQTRVFYDEKDIVTLAEDIRQQRQQLPDTLGLLQVPKGRLTDVERVQLGFGHRRPAAFSYLAQRYGSEWQMMPVQIEELTDEAMADMAWSENEVRADISAIEKAWALQRAMHRECGGQAQEALIDWEAEQRQLEQQRQQAALNHLRQIAIERTLLAPAGKGIDLSKPWLLTTIEALLVPDWDTSSMFHIITGWQQAIRAQLACELGHTDQVSKEVTYVLQDRFGELAQTPKTDNIHKLFVLLRERLVQSPEELSLWIACLALVRSWRDEVNTIEQIEEATRGISTL